jgi:Tol biopolymer transport system component
VVSLDGKYVAYADTTGVYIRHIDTGEVRPLQLPKGFDAVPTSWFPDGTHLLLNSGEAAQGRASLWKVSILGGSPQQLMENASEAAISPDGSKIAFLRGDALGSLEIWVMGTDGSNLHRITDASAAETPVPLGYGAGSQPLTGVHLSAVAWSPDGRQLAYLRRLKGGARSTLLEAEHSLEGRRKSVQRPRGHQARCCFHQHGQQDDHQAPAIGTNQFPNQSYHSTTSSMLRNRRPMGYFKLRRV